MKNPPGLRIFDQPQQIPILSAKKFTQNFFRKKILIFNAALLHLKFYYICSSKQYSRFGSANFGSQCTNFQLEFFDDHNFFGILPYHIHNEILILEGFDQFYYLLILAFFWFIWGQNDKKQN